MTSLKSALALSLLTLLGSMPAQADLAVAGHSTVVVLGMQGVGQEAVWLSKTRLRRDLIDRGRAYTHLFDLDTKEVTIIDHAMRQADVQRLTDLDTNAAAQVSAKEIKLDIKPTGRKRPLQKWQCAEHQMQLTMPVEVGGDKLEFNLSGTAWLARNTAEQPETATFVKATRTPDFFLSVPALARASPVYARGLSEAIRRIAPLGLVCSLDVDLRYEGTGRMAELSRKLASHLSVEYDRYETSPIPEGAFVIPAGYRIQHR
ncbi:MAG: hypothetical protein HZB71_10215 [Betaproteobacteria bacterium]|nr:hypothetical protein [Betaproteobacteria bacterium]